MNGRTNVCGKPEEEKTVTAGTSVIEVLPSSGKAMKKVTVNPTPTESKEVTAGTSDTTVSPTEGKHLSGVTVHPTPSQEKTVIPTADGFKVSPETGKLLSAVFVDGDSDLVAGNIKQGVNIFGVDGSFDNSNGAYVWKKYNLVAKSVTLSFTHIPPKTWTVSSNDIDVHSIDSSFFIGFSGYYVSPEYTYEFVDASQAVFDGKTYISYNYNPDTAQVVFDGTIAGGNINVSDATQEKTIHTFIGFVVSDQETVYPDGAEQGGYWYEKFDSSTLISKNIREGVDIWGVIGTMVEGASGIDYGTFKFTSSYQSNITVSHNLGVTPTHIIAILTQSFASVNASCCNVIYKGNGSYAIVYSGGWQLFSAKDTGANSNYITFYLTNSYFEPNKTYHWIAIA